MLLMAMALGAATLGPDPAPQPAKAEKRICKTTPRTGTRFPSKVCYTAAQWDEISEAAKRSARETVDRPFLPDCRYAAGGC